MVFHVLYLFELGHGKADRLNERQTEAIKTLFQGLCRGRNHAFILKYLYFQITKWPKSKVNNLYCIEIIYIIFSMYCTVSIKSLCKRIFLTGNNISDFFCAFL